MEPIPPEPAARRWPVRLILVGIVFALVLPGLIFCAVLIDRIAVAEHNRAEQALLATVGRVSDALDRELGNLAAAMVALATSPALDGGDLAAFDNQARTLAQVLGQAVVMSDLAGKQLVNTRRAFGDPMPTMPTMQAMDSVREVVASKQTRVSGLFTGATSGGQSVAVMHPVVRGGVVRYVIAVNLQPLYIAALLRNQGLPPDWIATLVDDGGRVVARNDQHERFVGQVVPIEPRRPPGEPLLRETTALTGQNVLAGTQWLRQADWRIGIGAPMHALDAPLRTTIALLGVTGAVTLVMAIVLALRLAGSVAAPLQRLAQAGAALGQGGPPIAVRSKIDEVDAVSRALEQAHAAAARFTESLEQQVAARTAELEDANQRLRDAIERAAQSEEQLRQAQKMEAVGQLTGGIAHDFNNLLTIVVGSLDLLRRRATDDRQRRLLDNALEGATRAATLTARLLAFSRRQPLQPQAVDVNRLVSGMSDLLHRTLGGAVQLETVLAGGVWQTHADPNQLENALLNLAVNGRDALVAAGRTDGRLVVETANAVLAGTDLDHDVLPGDFVQVSVHDSGTGMPPEVVERVFEPFFTTKPQGQGTGLGLSQVHGFVKQSGGQVRIRTAPDEGTTVIILLPRFTGEAALAAAADDEVPDGTGGQVVLLVEDDGGVRRFSVEALRDLGCTVLEADGGQQAMRLLDAHPEVTLLLTDVVLPGMNGVAIAAEARLRRPDLPVIFASGYTGAEGVHALPPGATLLQKPFTLQVLAAKLRSVLDPAPEA